MSYDRKKRFVLDYLADGKWRYGMEIVEASRGQLLKSTAYKTLERMENENLIDSKTSPDSPLNIKLTERLFRKILYRKI